MRRPASLGLGVHVAPTEQGQGKGTPDSPGPELRTQRRLHVRRAWWSRGLDKTPARRTGQTPLVRPHRPSTLSCAHPAVHTAHPHCPVYTILSTPPVHTSLSTPPVRTVLSTLSCPHPPIHIHRLRHTCGCKAGGCQQRAPLHHPAEPRLWRFRPQELPPGSPAHPRWACVGCGGGMRGRTLAVLPTQGGHRCELTDHELHGQGLLSPTWTAGQVPPHGAAGSLAILCMCHPVWLRGPASAPPAAAGLRPPHRPRGEGRPSSSGREGPEPRGPALL